MPISLPSQPVPPEGASRAQRLKAGTDRIHQGIDQRIMAKGITASRTAFAGFVRVQHRLHRDAHALYTCPQLLALLPCIAGRHRLTAIERDLQDLGAGTGYAAAPQPVIASVPHGLGWLYVLEGSALGGAVILKLAAGLGVHAGFGARHLAPLPEGVAAAWRSFTTELDAITLDDTKEALVLQGATDAFQRVADYVAQEFD